MTKETHAQWRRPMCPYIQMFLVWMTFCHLCSHLGQTGPGEPTAPLRMIKLIRWHNPQDTELEIRALADWDQTHYLSVTKAPLSTEYFRVNEEQGTNPPAAVGLPQCHHNYVLYSVSWMLKRHNQARILILFRLLDMFLHFQNVHKQEL